MKIEYIYIIFILLFNKFNIIYSDTQNIDGGSIDDNISGSGGNIENFKNLKNDNILLKEMNQECNPYINDCKFGSTCINFDGTNKCFIEQNQIDGYCNETVKCKYNLECLENKCKISHFLFIDEKCNHDYECISSQQSGIEIKCLDGICKKVKDINNCTSNLECPIGTVCHFMYDAINNKIKNKNGYCDEGGSKGGLCHISYPCKSGLFCKHLNKNDEFGLCSEYYRGGEGSDCNSNFQCQVHNSFYCNNSKCTKYILNSNFNNNCSNCNEYFECNNNSTCQQYTHLPGSDYYKIVYKIQSCKTKYQIPDNSNEFIYNQYSLGSLFSIKCGLEVCSAFSNFNINNNNSNDYLNLNFKIKNEKDQLRFIDYCSEIMKKYNDENNNYHDNNINSNSSNSNNSNSIIYRYINNYINYIIIFLVSSLFIFSY